ncbi:hypothetical protein FRB97_003828 [Tulasnella sp. 331]|nr:hypothetical protein FRB97_003828 [Tulasnella sp. 331]
MMIKRAAVNNTATTSATGGINGVIVDLTMQGDGENNCAYTVQALVGSSQNPFLLQVDTGSADLWIASTSCSSNPSCSDFKGAKYDASTATTQTGQKFGLIYQTGGVVGGTIVVDKLDIGGYIINGQALAAASDIQNEALTIGAGFSGLLGLGPQADSIIATSLSSSNPASVSTFSTNILSNTSNSSNGLSTSTPGPSNHFISVLLERPFYPTIPSRLGLGAHPPLPYSLSPSQIQYSPIAASNSGPGPLYWRVPVTAVTAYVKGAPMSIPLSATTASDVTSIWPVAVFASGGISMVSTRSFANAFYGAWGIGPGADDMQYYVPCTLAMNVTLTMGQGISIQVPLHPLDMSVSIQSQPDSDICLGALQATDSSIAEGDLVLGAAFLRNVYTVLSYQTNPPQLGILPLTNMTAALEEFNTVRVLHRPIGNGLSPSQQAAGYTSSFSGSTQVLNTTDNDGGEGVKLGLSILGGILGFLALAGGLLWLSVRLLRKRLMMEGRAGSTLSGRLRRGGSRRESGAFALNGAEKTKSGKSSKIRRPGLSYDGEEAFAMFSGAPRSLTTPNPLEEVLDIGQKPGLDKDGDGDRSSIVTTIVNEDPFESFRRMSHRQQDSDMINFSFGSARDSRYPTMHAHSRSQSHAHSRSKSGHSRMASSSGNGALKDVPAEEDLGTIGYLPRD